MAKSGPAPTINDVARVAGVSKKTVSRVINRSPLLKQATREKFEKVIASVEAKPVPDKAEIPTKSSEASKPPAALTVLIPVNKDRVPVAVTDVAFKSKPSTCRRDDVRVEKATSS